MSPGERVIGRFGRFPVMRTATIIAASGGELIVETMDGVRHSVQASSVQPMDEGKAAKRVEAILKAGSRLTDARASERTQPVRSTESVPEWPDPDREDWS